MSESHVFDAAKVSGSHVMVYRRIFSKLVFLISVVDNDLTWRRDM